MQKIPDDAVITRRPARILDHAASVCVIVLTATILYGQFVDRRSQPPPVRAGAGEVVRRTPERPLPLEPVSLDGAAVKGRRDARVAIIEYSDFQCPFCARFAIDTLPEIDKTYIATGKVLMAFRHLPLEAIHPFAVAAGASAECAGQQGRFWDMHDRLFQNPRQLDPSTLREHAQALSLDLGTYDACLTAGAAEKVRADGAGAAAAGVSGTPGFLLGTVESDGRVETCYENMMEFENGNDITCMDYGTCDPAADPEVCGNYFCGDGETYSNCPGDCDLNIGSGPTCSNSSCELGEDSKNCGQDCVDQDECGDHICDLGETASNCAGDCYQAGFCATHEDCQGDYGNGYICARQRCVYEPGAQWCDPQLQALDCPSPAMKCVNNVCVEVF